MTEEDKKIRYGEVDIGDDQNEKPRIRTTLFLDTGLCKSLEDKAQSLGFSTDQTLESILSEYFKKKNY